MASRLRILFCVAPSLHRFDARIATQQPCQFPRELTANSQAAGHTARMSGLTY